MFIAISGFFSRFRRDEDGSLFIFSLILFFLMVMMGGFAVDLMRYENTRTHLQNTLDRSTLAAAALSQKLDREAVVRDYMKKAGIIDQLASVTVTEGQDATAVQAVGRAETNPFFMHLLGIKDFDAFGRSKAEQAISNVEIVLVLDVSGSMQGTKIIDLKAAAANFVDTVLGNDPYHRISISIVPYNAQVNIGTDLTGEFNLTDVHGVANVKCVELPASVGDSLAIPQNLPMPMMAYADANNTTNKTDAYVSPIGPYGLPNYNGSFCKPLAHNQVRLPSNDAATLKGYINGLQAIGNTSISLGMKWGVTMTDPSMRPAFTNFIAENKIPANLPARPYDYDDTNASKIVILMTDGEHVAHRRIVDGYKSLLSGIFLSPSDGNYSVRHTTLRPATAGTNEYYVPHLDTWQATPWGTNAVQQDWRNIWAKLKLTYVAWQFYGRALSNDYTTQNAIYNTELGKMRKDYASVDAMDTSLQQSCDQAKDAGVTVYGIAFGAPLRGQQVIAACASQGMYFQPSDDGGTEIQAAFNAIASNITMLKLTQ